MQQPKPPTPQSTPPPVIPRAPANIQQAQQQMSMPHAQPPVQVPKPPAPPMTQPAMQPMQQNPTIAKLMQLLGGSA